MFQLSARRPTGSYALTCLRQVRSQRGTETQGASLLHAAEEAITAGNVEFAINALERFQLIALGLTAEHNALIQLSVFELRRPRGGNLFGGIGVHFLAALISSFLHEWCRGLLNSLFFPPYLGDKWAYPHENIAGASHPIENRRIGIIAPGRRCTF